MLRLFLGAVLPLTAQVVTITPPEIAGVTVTQTFPDLEGLVPVTVSNTGTRPIRVITVRWLREAGGQANVSFVSRNMSAALVQGRSWQFEGAANPWGAEGDPQRVTVSVDSVLFEDGEFAGPDILGSRARLSAEREAIQRMTGQAQGLIGGTDEEIRAWLAQMAVPDFGSMWLRSQASAWLVRFRGEGRSVLPVILRELSRMEQSTPLLR